MNIKKTRARNLKIPLVGCMDHTTKASFQGPSTSLVPYHSRCKHWLLLNSIYKGATAMLKACLSYRIQWPRSMMILSVEQSLCCGTRGFRWVPVLVQNVDDSFDANQHKTIPLLLTNQASKICRETPRSWLAPRWWILSRLMAPTSRACKEGAERRRGVHYPYNSRCYSREKFRIVYIRMVKAIASHHNRMKEYSWYKKWI